MNKEEIVMLLDKEYQRLVNWLKDQPEKNWEKGPEGKWTTGQQVLHLVQSLQPLNKALRVPKFILKFKFEKANRAVRDFDTVMQRYQDRLRENQGAATQFNQKLKTPSIQERKQLIATLTREYTKLQKHTKKWKDRHLDTCILPHPLMGKMPIRELIMWSAYHANHHTNELIEKY